MDKFALEILASFKSCSNLLQKKAGLYDWITGTNPAERFVITIGNVIDLTKKEMGKDVNLNVVFNNFLTSVGELSIVS